MDEKTLHILEYDKLLDRLAEYCAFSASAEKARSLRPSEDILDARSRLAVTSEAIKLLTTHPGFTIGGARDVREAVDLAQHGGILDTGDLLDVKYTLIAARTLGRKFERLSEPFPHLSDLAAQLPPPMGIIDAVSSSLSDRGDILDSASSKLGNIRRDLRIVHDRLLGKLQRIVSDSKYAPFLQEALVTQRDGRYVIPLRAEFKGRIRSIVHDQSASGATLFVEPLTVVEQNNQYREFILAERDEERRILAELSAMVGMHAFEIIHAINVLADLDLALACAIYADSLDATEPELLAMGEYQGGKKGKKENNNSTGIERHHQGSVIRLFQARHPLLDPEDVVPIDIELDAETYALVITGPNTGGKTVTLKTVGLLVIMAQSGLHVPVQSGSEISHFKNVFADIGDEQSIEQSLSTFSSHITNIIRILDQADDECLVILDELGAGTDPQEGAALARALLDQLVGRGITTLVTTHHPELKAYAHTIRGVANASVQFDLETLKPTFHLMIGIPGRSNALAIAQRLGLPDLIVENARSEINPTDLRADDLLDEIHRQHDLAVESRKLADAARHEAEDYSKELVKRLEHIEDERREILNQAMSEAEGRIEALQDEIDGLRRALKRARQPVETINEIEKHLDTVRKTTEKPIERKLPDVRTAHNGSVSIKRRPIQLGDRVQLRSLNTRGVVTALSEEEAEVQVGVLRVKTRLVELDLVSSAEDVVEEDQKDATRLRRTEKRLAGSDIIVQESPGIELDLRGRRADEAIDALENYMDAAYLARLPYVRIIHGKGTGKLRSVVRAALKNHPHVKTFEAGGEKEGGEGVTVVKFIE